METPVSFTPADGRSPADATSASSASASDSALYWKTWTRQLLRWCLPALLLGLGLRIALVWSMPYGYVQYDSSDYLVTTDHLIEKHEFYIHNKRSYLTPALFSAAFLLPVPATVTIAAAQHFMGLLGIVVVGALVRLWFRFWRAAIIPVTVLFAATPSIIWYEHTIMGEAQFLFFTLIMVLAGTLFAQRPTLKGFFWFLGSLLLVFGTRLESKTFVLFALLLPIFYFWKQWRQASIALLSVVVAFEVAFHVSGDRDVSSLVYASIIRFAPTTSASTPDIMPLLLPIRERARRKSEEYPTKIVRVSKQINHAVEDYVGARVKGKRKQAAEESRIMRNLCLETLKAEPVRTIMEPWLKFRLALDAWSSYCWDKRALWQSQHEAMINKDWMTTTLGKGLTGQALTLEQVPDWIKAHYRASSVEWFTRFQSNWNKRLIHFRTADTPMASQRWVHDFFGGINGWRYKMPGVPYFYIIGFLGMFAAVVRPSRFRALHFAWVVTVLGGLYVCCMAGVTNGRFRFVYEPFFLFYFFLFFDCVASFFKRSREPREASPACST